MSGFFKSKKMKITTITLCAIFIATLLSLIMVFAAQSQNVETQIDMSYTSHNVHLTLSGKYWKTGDTEKTTSSGGVNGEISYNEEYVVSTNELNSGLSLTLNSSVTRYVFEYKLNNESNSTGFSYYLDEKPSLQNVRINYFISTTEQDVSTMLNKTSQLLDNGSFSLSYVDIGKDNVNYIYVIYTINDVSSPATVIGNMTWSINWSEKVND